MAPDRGAPAQEFAPVSVLVLDSGAGCEGPGCSDECDITIL